MKLVLFICISLFASLLHAAATPMANMGDTPMTHEVEMVGQHSPEQHAKMMQGDHQKSAEHCPDNDYSCCIAVALQPASLSSVILVSSTESYAPRPLYPPRLRPDVLYRPPKFYPVLAG